MPRTTRRTTDGALGIALVAALTSAWSTPAAAEVSASITAPDWAYATIKVITFGDGPQGIAINDSDDTIYVADRTNGDFYIFNGMNLDDSTVIGIGDTPENVAVNQDDDTVYVTVGFDNQLVIYDGSTNSEVGRLELGGGTDPRGVAVNQKDDTVYVSLYDTGKLLILTGSTDDSSEATIGSGAEPELIAVNQSDDTVYVVEADDDDVQILAGRNVDDSIDISVGDSPEGISVNNADDTIYVANRRDGNLSVINGTTNAQIRIRVGDSPYGVAVHQASGTVFVANRGDRTLSIISGSNTDDSQLLQLQDAPRNLAIDQDDTLIYATSPDQDSLSVIAPVAPTLQTTSGSAGDTVTVSLNVAGLPASYLFDDSTLAGLTFGATPATDLTRTPGTNTWSATVPAGTGTTTVTATLNGNLSATAGTFTYGSAPTPPPAIPAGPPTDIAGTPGDAQIAATWTPPASSGSFPVTTYQVRTTPTSSGCLTTTTTCTLTSLSNGTSYTLEARALNGAGWGPWSAPSAAITPVSPPDPTLLITGSRGDVRGKPGVLVSGSSTDLSTGTALEPRIKFAGQSEYANGKSRPTLDDDGIFTWQRRTAKKIYVYFRTLDEQVRSNRIIIPR